MFESAVIRGLARYLSLFTENGKSRDTARDKGSLMRDETVVEETTITTTMTTTTTTTIPTKTTSTTTVTTTSTTTTTITIADYQIPPPLVC